MYDEPLIDMATHWSYEAESGVVGGLMAGGAEAYDA